MTLNFAKHGPGFYHLNCSARDWGTDTLFSYTVTIPVRAVIPPRFHSTHKNVSLKVGEWNRRLSCDVTGDPAPTVSWDHGGLPRVRTEVFDLVFLQVLAEWANERIVVSCTGTNKFGDSATKNFYIHVLKPAETTEESTIVEGSISMTTIIGIVVGLLVAILLLGLGLFFLYYRMTTFGRTIVQYLTKEEEQEFREGRQGQGPGRISNEANQDQSSQGYENDALAIDCLKYDSEYEVGKRI